MEIQTNKSQNLKHNSFISDDFEIEDIPFTPINEGLGFHEKHSDVKRPFRTTKQHTEIFEEIHPTIEIGKKSSKTSEMPRELAAFYKEPIHSTPKVNRDIDLCERLEKPANLKTRVMAFLVDEIFCALLLSIITSVMFISTSFSLNQFKSMIMSDYNYLFILVLFILIHYIYNIAIGFQASLGQRLFKLEPKFDFTTSLSVAYLLKRSTLELIALVTLGVPYLLKMDVELLENKIIRK